MTAPRPSRTLSRVVVTALLCWSAIVGPAAAADTYRSVGGVAPGHVVWIHAAPDVAAKRVGYLKANAWRVRTMECKRLAKGGWCRVQALGTRGWVQDRYLKPVKIMRG